MRGGRLHNRRWRRVGFLLQGCALHLQRPEQRQKLGSCEMTGWVRLRGAAQVRPCKLGRRIHAAHAPSTGPTRLRQLAAICRKHSWGQIRFPQENGSDPVPFRQIAENCRRRGGSGCGGVSRMDAATELTWTYLQRPPQPDPPRLPTDSQLLPLTLTLIRQVQGCKPCRTPLNAWARAARAFPRISGHAARGDGPVPAASADAGWPGRRHRALRPLPAPAAQNPSRPPGVPRRAR